MPKPIIGGYIFRQEINRAQRANRAARVAIQQILDNAGNSRALSIALTKATLALAENLEAIQELERIVTRETPLAATSGDE
jgi:hypothetical protein